MSKHPEHDLQVQCVNWYRAKYPRGIIFAVPNQGKRTISQLAYFIQEGFTIGAPDLVVMSTNNDIIFVELKTKKGVLSEKQIVFKEKCQFLKVGLYNVARSLEEFKEIVERE